MTRADCRHEWSEGHVDMNKETYRYCLKCMRIEYEQ